MAGNRPKLIQQVFEARYERGYKYLDRCGDVMLILEDLLPQETSGSVWMPDEMRPTGARVKCPDFDLVIIFDAGRLIVDQNPAEKECAFEAICSLVLGTIMNKLEISSVVRFGGRRMFILPADSVEDAHLLSVQKLDSKALPEPRAGQMKLTKSETTRIFEAEDGSMGVRLIVSPVVFKVDAPITVDERLKVPPHLLPKGQKEALIEQLRRRRQRENDPAAGLLIDVDYYRIRPSSLVVVDFLKEAWEEANYFASTICSGGGK